MKKGSTRIETLERIRYVQECLLNDYESGVILKSVTDKWGVTERQGYRYLWAAWRFFENEKKKSIEAKTAYYLNRKRRLIREMDPKEKKTAAGVRTIDKVLNGMAKLEGVSVNTLKLIGDPDKPVSTVSTVISPQTIDYSKIPTELLEWVVANRKATNV